MRSARNVSFDMAYQRRNNSKFQEKHLTLTSNEMKSLKQFESLNGFTQGKHFCFHCFGEELKERFAKPRSLSFDCQGIFFEVPRYCGTSDLINFAYAFNARTDLSLLFAHTERFSLQTSSNLIFTKSNRKNLQTFSTC
jgi:hypothetical protein